MSDDKASRKERQAFMASKADRSKDPCYDENQRVVMCLTRYCRQSCLEEQTDYRLCRKFWSQVQTERKRKGICPGLPGPEERKQIFERFKKTGVIG